MLRLVEPPSIDPEADPRVPDPHLTDAVYQGLDALIDFRRERPATDDAYFWTLIRASLRRAPVASLHLAHAIAGGLEDGLAWEYDHQGWKEGAEGWREASRVVRERAKCREGRQRELRSE